MTSLYGVAPGIEFAEIAEIVGKAHSQASRQVPAQARPGRVH